ncbi:MAG: hypothetical protein KF726_10730 [Anaerolineae bacterium]|nr:hypothetical protein [Anaerolineae bacterium]
MDLTQQAGILGTGAYLASDLALLLYIFMLVPAMLVGFSFARRHLFVPHHKFTMTAITIINWIIIILLMLVTYRNAVAPNVPRELNRLPFLIPVLHGITGGLAQIIATVLVLRMWLEPSLPRVLRFEPIKPWMRLTLGLWLVTAVLGIAMYVTWNIAGQPPVPSTEINATVEPGIEPTGEVEPTASVEGTADASADVDSTPDAAPPAEVEATVEATPAQ